MKPEHYKLLLINILVFILLMVMVYRHAELSMILETGIGFYSMELGFLMGKGHRNDKNK